MLLVIHLVIQNVEIKIIPINNKNNLLNKIIFLNFKILKF